MAYKKVSYNRALEGGETKGAEGKLVGKCLVAHKGRLPGWQIDHVLTGYRVVAVRTLDDAKTVASSLERAMPPAFCRASPTLVQNAIATNPRKADVAEYLRYVTFWFFGEYKRPVMSLSAWVKAGRPMTVGDVTKASRRKVVKRGNWG